MRFVRQPSLVLALLTVCAAAAAVEQSSVVEPGAKLTKVGDDFQFTEGPAPDAQGNVYFSDVRAGRTYKWTLDGKTSVWRDDTGNANGLAFDQGGNLLTCEGGRGRVAAVDPAGKVSVVADQYRGKPFNQPNDLWIDPQGGVYFSDPIYGRARRNQDGEHVYYVSPDRKRVVRVIDDMVRPNGLVGTPDGKILYVTDHGDKKTYRYDIASAGVLVNKRLFFPAGADGMKLDREGNLYMAEDGIVVCNAAGKHLETIAVPEQPTNLCFAGPDGRTLFITARSTLYALRMRVAGSTFRQP
jgi:gluconolactonase